MPGSLIAAVGTAVGFAIGLSRRLSEVRSSQGRSGRNVSSGADDLRRCLFDEAPIAYHEIDTGGRIRRVNRAECALLGYEASELIGHPIWKFVSPGERVLSRLAVERKIARQQRLERFEREYIRKDGSRIFVEIHESLIHDATGAVTGIRTALLDVTDRKRAAAGLRDSERRFRLLIEGVRDCALFLLAADGSVTSWNEGAERIHGYNVEEAVGRDFCWFFPIEDVQKGESERVLRSTAEHGCYQSEGWRIHKNHGRFWGRLDVQALRDESGRVEGFAVVTRDLTELRQAQERVGAYSVELRQKNLELTDLIAAVREAWHADTTETVAGLPVAGWEAAAETTSASTGNAYSTMRRSISG